MKSQPVRPATTPDQLRYERALALRPNLALALTRCDQPDVIAAFQYGLQVAPADDILYLNLGRVHLSRSERDRAREVVRMWVDHRAYSAAARKALRDPEGP